MAATSLSRKILIGLFVLFLLSWFHVLDPVTTYIVAVPAQIYPGLELWRLVTYPLAPGFFGFIIAAICFAIPGEELENMLGTRQFGLLLLVVTVLTALMHVALFFGSDIRFVLYGPTNPAIFVLVGFYYLFPHSEIRILFFNIRVWVIIALIAGILVVQGIVGWTMGQSPLLFFSNGGFGLLLGAIYFHSRFQKYAFLLRPIRSVERMVERVGLSATPQKQKPAGIPYRGPTVTAVRPRKPFQKTIEMTDEERLNMILDRINEKGYDSLSEEEQRFLREYSRKL